MKPSIKSLWIARSAVLIGIWIVLAVLHILNRSL